MAIIIRGADRQPSYDFQPCGECLHGAATRANEAVNCFSETVFVSDARELCRLYDEVYRALGLKLRIVFLYGRTGLLISTGRGALCWMAALPHYGVILMLQKNAERECVRDQQYRHNESRNEVSGSQLPRQ